MTKTFGGREGGGGVTRKHRPTYIGVLFEFIKRKEYKKLSESKDTSMSLTLTCDLALTSS